MSVFFYVTVILGYIINCAFAYIMILGMENMDERPGLLGGLSLVWVIGFIVPFGMFFGLVMSYALSWLYHQGEDS